MTRAHLCVSTIWEGDARAENSESRPYEDQSKPHPTQQPWIEYFEHSQSATDINENNCYLKMPLTKHALDAVVGGDIEIGMH